MNANELADELSWSEMGTDEIETWTKEAATMLRQQQAEIEALKETVDKLLNHCDDPECWECGKIICPYGGEMHFHHDGCPICAQMESQNEQ
jgi:rubrerythrin